MSDDLFFVLSSRVFQLSGDHREEIKGPKSRVQKTTCTPKTCEFYKSGALLYVCVCVCACVSSLIKEVHFTLLCSQNHNHILYVYKINLKLSDSVH